MISLFANHLFAQRNEKFLFRSAILVYSVIILVGAVPGARAEMNQVASGFVLHFIAYASIALGLFCGFSGTWVRKSIKTFLSVILMGGFDEFLQSFLPYRRGAVEDWLVDITASIFAIAFCWILGSRRSGSTPLH